eukprot:jgi/Mesen1/1751/ME001390S00746
MTCKDAGSSLESRKASSSISEASAGHPHDKPAPSTFPVNCRYRFTTKDFAKAHDLREPVAGLYFTSEKEKDVCKPCRYRRGITLELGLNTV